MEENNRILKIISNETKNSIDQMGIVTPEMYSSIFANVASEHNTNLSDTEELSKQLLNLECSTLTNMQKQTAKDTLRLSDSTVKAINAIKEKDEKLLNEVLQETESLRKELEKLKEAVYKDELTQVHNRKWIHDNLLEENSEDFKDKGILSIIDLNYFKLVNDTHGHIIGDKVLIYIAQNLRKSGHHVIRYGGDEFLVIFSEKTLKKHALDILHKIRESVLAKKLKAPTATFNVSFSIGVCAFKSGDNMAKIIESADKDMYKDKIEIKKRITGI